jgi:hypothetical protein
MYALLCAGIRKTNNSQQHYVQTFYTEFYLNWTANSQSRLVINWSHWGNYGVYCTYLHDTHNFSIEYNRGIQPGVRVSPEVREDMLRLFKI